MVVDMNLLIRYVSFHHTIVSITLLQHHIGGRASVYGHVSDVDVFEKTLA